MAKFSLRRYEDQAKASLVFGIVGCLSLLAQILLVFRHVDTNTWSVMYGNMNRKYLILLATAVSLFLGAIALGLGFNSAGQRRNEKTKLSWLGFFLGAGAVCLAIIVACFFQFRSEYMGAGR